MKISDFIFKYKAGFGIFGEAICRVRTFATPGGEAVAVLTDLGNKNTGQSVTNSIELLRDALVESGIIDAKALIVEHYERDDCTLQSFDWVTITPSRQPIWKRAGKIDVEQYIGCARGEFDSHTLQDKRLYGEIEKLRNQIRPLAGSRWRESNEVIRRRIAIERKMIRKNSIKELVDARAKELDLQRLLKSDLSVFGEIYAPDDEYICFSEFPVGDGKVDFVLFTGRSRMDVILIEIKGADYFLVNQDSYGNLASKTNEVAEQIRTRLRYIYDHLAQFRQAVHSARDAAESGRSIHNCLVGPKGRLQVDPQKDITIQAVLIGGRTRQGNDAEESRKRNTFESTFNLPLKLESWDSWLYKIRRS